MFTKGDRLINKHIGNTATFLDYADNLIILVVDQWDYSCMVDKYSYHVESDWRLIEE